MEQAAKTSATTLKRYNTFFIGLCILDFTHIIFTIIVVRRIAAVSKVVPLYTNNPQPPLGRGVGLFFEGFFDHFCCRYDYLFSISILLFESYKYTENERESNLLLTVGVEIDRVFVVVFTAEDDFDVAVVLRAVQLDGAVLGFLLVEFRDFDRSSIGQVIRMLSVINFLVLSELL